MAGLPEARVGHWSAGRLRLRIPERRHDAAFFRAVGDRLSAWDSVERVEVNPLTASVLVQFSDLHGLILENAAKNDLFALMLDESGGGRTPASVKEQAARGAAVLDDAVRHWSGGGVDLRGAVFLLLLAGSAVQLLRGNIAAPAVTLLWYAGDMLGLWRLGPPPPGNAAETAAGD